MEKIIFATGNEHKMIEIRAILSDLGAEILSQKEAGIKADVVEDGATFEENAMIKATEIAKIANQMPEYKNAVVLADDSGLEIDYLNKEPGIYSARYMGEDTSYHIKNVWDSVSPLYMPSNWKNVYPVPHFHMHGFLENQYPFYSFPYPGSIST